MKRVSILAATFLPFLSMAHAGHGPVQEGLAHYILSPIHVIGLLVLGVVGYGICRLKGKKA